MESSSVQVTVANTRKKCLYFSIAVLLNIAITTTGILIYDRIQEQQVTLTARPGPAGHTVVTLTSNGTNGSVTTQTTMCSTISSESTIGETSSASPTTTEVYSIDCSECNIAVGQIVVHKIYPFGSASRSAFVQCSSTNDGSWTVIQRRFNGVVDFYRTWKDYKDGFGDASGEYWLGNDAIHELTSRASYKLKVVLKDWDNVTAYAMFDTFRISDENDGYRLSVGGYNGNAGNSLEYHNGQMFSTRDRNNDSHPDRFCAEKFMGAWWHESCFRSNLNGHYYNETHASNIQLDGILWQSFRTSLSLKETMMMMIRKTA